MIRQQPYETDSGGVTALSMHADQKHRVQWPSLLAKLHHLTLQQIINQITYLAHICPVYSDVTFPDFLQ